MKVSSYLGTCTALLVAMFVFGGCRDVRGFLAALLIMFVGTFLITLVAVVFTLWRMPQWEKDEARRQREDQHLLQRFFNGDFNLDK